MPTPRRTFAAIVVLVAAILTSALPAAAQSPGANGTKTYGDNNHLVVPCMSTDLYGAPGPFNRYLQGGIAWAPDGNRIAIAVESGTFLSSSGTELITLTTSPCTTPRSLGPVDWGSRASFSPDGKQVAVQRAGDIWIVDVATGKALRNLTPNLASTRESNPSWSPKNSAIAYTASDGIRTRPVAGGPSTLWKKGVLEFADYSPDGTKIAYLEAGRIKYAATSTGSTVVTTPIQAEGHFTWSPDGQRFFFTSTLDVTRCVVATTTGKVLERVTAINGPCTAASWQPKR